jgi:hypothetical protein
MKMLLSAKVLVAAIFLVFLPLLWGQWVTPTAPFTATAIAANGNTIWICGPIASIASSVDGGNHWEIRNSKDGANSLLTLRWTNAKVAAAGGTGGLLLVTVDGGVHWQQIVTSLNEPILDASFSDDEHGIILTTSSALYTADAGKHWATALPSSTAELSRYKFVLSVAALDKQHAVVLAKEGPAQYYSGRLLATSDAGATWKVTDIEHTTLNNLLITHDQFWLVGTEVVEREKRGGHAVPATFHSSDAVNWERGPKPLIDTNYACKPEGCLMWNGAVFDPFVPNGAIRTFPSTPSLSTQWAATDNRICTLSPKLQCAETAVVKTLPEQGGPAPQLAATELRTATGDVAGKCIRCDYPHILVNEQFGGKATVKLSMLARPDGTVSSVEVVNTPNPEIGNALAHAASAWIFYPVLRDGVAVPTRRNLELTVTVIKPH